MNVKHAIKLIRDVYSTQDNEIQCEQAGILMARCADLWSPQGGDEELRQWRPELWRHFDVCSDCKAEYQLMIDLARLEAAGQQIKPDYIPPLPDGGRPALWLPAQDAIVALFPGFAPALAKAIMRGRAWGEEWMEPVEVVLPLTRGASVHEGELHIEVDVAPYEPDASLRELFCTVWTSDEALQNDLEGAPLWLQIEDEGPVIRESALDDLGETSFTHLPSGRYALRLRLAGQEYAITEIIVP